MTDTGIRGTTVRVNGADLYHEVRGRDEPLLLIQGATGDGSTFQQIAENLSSENTVVTYHRRGNSLSPRPTGWTSTTIDEQADDAAGLLRALGLAPAVVFGTSLGAVILLNMMLRHPGTLRGAIIHEPPLLSVLPNGSAIETELNAMVEEGLATVGPRATMEMFLRLNTGDENFENLDSSLRERMLGNAEVFFFTELEATVPYVPDAEALSRCEIPTRVIAGAGNRDHFYHASSAWVARQLGMPLREIPGAHTPYLDYPGDLANMIRTFIQGLD